MDIIDFLKENKEIVLEIDRTGNIISFYLKDDFKLQKIYNTKNKAIKEYTKFRRYFLNIRC